jgi:hypothetical protein
MTKALPPLLVAGFGAAIALLVFTVHPGASLIPLIPLGIGMWAMSRAKAMVKADDPVGSLSFFELAQLLPYAIAAAASALLIGLAVWFAPPEKPTPAPNAPPPPPPTPFETYFPEILKALAGAASVFITAAFIKSSEEPDSWVADLVKREFQKAYESRFPNNPNANSAVRAPTYLGLGWEKEGRQKRAAAIAAAIKDGT